jgi:hypothetical protein
MNAKNELRWRVAKAGLVECMQRFREAQKGSGHVVEFRVYGTTVLKHPEVYGCELVYLAQHRIQSWALWNKVINFLGQLNYCQDMKEESSA